MNKYTIIIIIANIIIIISYYILLTIFTGPSSTISLRYQGLKGEEDMHATLLASCTLTKFKP